MAQTLTKDISQIDIENLQYLSTGINMLLKYDTDDIVKYLTGSSLLDISNLLYEAVQEYELDQQRRQNEGWKSD